MTDAERAPRATSPAKLARDLASGIPTGRPETADDVPVYSAQQSGGTVRATLMFRVGEADERLGVRGQCHLLTQIVLDEFAQGNNTVAITAHVTTLRTSITICGDAQDVVTSLNRVARVVSLLRLDEIDRHVANVLANWRPLERWDNTLSTMRFGGRGYGLSGFPLLGLKYLDTDSFTEWVRMWFTCGNAVVSTTHDLPVGLDLSPLGPGMRKALPDPHPVELPYPVVAGGPESRLAVSFLGHFDALAELSLMILSARLTKRCAEISPSISRPSIVTRRVGFGLGTVAFAFKAQNELINELRDSVSSELFTFAMNGPAVTELEAARVRFRRHFDQPTADEETSADRNAVEHLFGESHDMHGALSAEPDRIADLVRTAMSQTIWLVPPDVRLLDQRLTRTTTGADTPLAGDEFASLIDGPHTRLTTSAEGLTLRNGTGSVTIRFADAVAVEQEADGSRSLWGANGQRIRVVPAAWQASDRIIAWIDANVEPWIVLGQASNNLNVDNPVAQ